MRCPTLRRDTFATFELGLLLDSRDEHDDAPYQRKPSEYRRNRNVIVFFRGCVNRSDIKNFFLMSVGKSLIGESKTAQNDEEDSTPNVRFHVLRKRRLYRPPPALNQVNYKDGQSHEEKNVDESSEGVGRRHTKEPENN
jgi:hypothetical protein